MELSFAGKKAIVTGAGKGIGRAIAKKLQECGAEVFAVSRTAADLASLQAEAPGIKTVEVDLSKWDEARQAMADLGPVDLLVNNAGISRLAPFLEMKREDLESVMNVNFNAVFNVSQVVAGAMVKAGRGGAIVNVSSTASQLALVEHANYCASKAALDMLTKIMALELGPHKIRVNSVNPTVVMTEMGRYAWSDPAKSGPVLARIPLGKFVEIEDVVHATLFLLSDQAAMVNGTSLPVDGGLLCN